MSFKKISRQDIYRILTAIAIVITLAASIYAVYTGRRYFSNRNLRQIGVEIKSYGVWSPIIIFVLFVLSTVIPPIPIPTTFLEIAAGIIFGFWPGVILIWISQFVSAVACFSLSHKVGKIFADKIAKSKIFTFFREFIEKKRAWAVFVLRATMSAPFNVSYFAGLMQMDGGGFVAASAFGIIPETILFVFLGTLIDERVRFRLWYVFLGTLILNYLPLLIVMLSKYFHRKNKVR